MATITTRAGKGSPLTNTEVDDNFSNLNSAKYESGSNVSFGTLSSGVQTISGSNGTGNETSLLSFVAATDALGSLRTYNGGGYNQYIRFYHGNGVAGSGEALAFQYNHTAVVFNEDSYDQDFRVESNDNANMLFVDASTNRVGINTNLPETPVDFHVAAVQIRNDTSGANEPKLIFNNDLFAGANHGFIQTSNGGLQLDFEGGSTSTFTGRAKMQLLGGGQRHIRFSTSTDNGSNFVERFEIGNTDIVANETGVDQDFRVESNSNANMLFVDGGLNKVGIGVVPVEGALTIKSAGNTYATSALVLEDVDSTTRTYITHVNGTLAISNNSSRDDLLLDSSGNLKVVTGALQLRDVAQSIDFIQSGAINFDSNSDQIGRVLTIGSNRANSASGGITNVTFDETGGTVFNEGGVDADFRVESDSNSHMLYVDGGANVVTMGMANPTIPSFVGNNSVMMADNLFMFQAANSGESNFNISQDNNYAYILHNGYWNGAWKQHNNGFGVQMLRMGSSSFQFEAAADVGADDTNVGAFTNIFRGGLTEVCVNDHGGNIDFRVESDSNTHALFVDAGNDRVKINTTAGTAGNLVVVSNSSANAIQMLARPANDYAFLNFYNNAGTSQFGAIAGISSGMLFYDNAGTERFRIQNSQVVVNDPSNDIDFRVESNAQSHMFFVDAGANRATFGQAQASITSGGMYMDLSNDSQAHMGICISESADSVAGLYINRQNYDGSMIIFRRANSQRGSITITSSGTSYNTTSDRRLKKDIETITDGTDKLMAMNPVTHGWKADPEADAVHGFIAQEMMDIVPEAVSGEPEGDEMMSMDYGRITPVLVAALQDAHKKIAELETRLTELEGN